MNNNYIHKNEDIINYINENSLSHILSYSILCRNDFLTQAIKHKDIMEALFNKMSVNLDLVPFLFPRYEDSSNTPFDTCEPWMITPFIKLMLAKDSRGLLYNSIIYKNKERLISLGIDLKSYFESPLVLH